MDTLSDVLRVVRLTGAVYFTIDAEAAIAVHKEAHGLVADSIEEVTEGK